MIRRRKSAILSQAAFSASTLGRLVSHPVAQAAITPRSERIIDLLQLREAKNYVDFGCGTAPYAYLLNQRAGREAPPLCLDLLPGRGVDVVAWPEHLPFADQSVHAMTSFYLIRRFDDDVVHAFGGEISRVLAPGGAALLLEVAPVMNERINHWNERAVAGGCAEVDLRGWGRLAALLTECEFDAIDLVNVGPFFLPPVPRIGVLLRRASWG